MSGIIILLDVSISMAESVGGLRRIDILERALRQIAKTLPAARLFAFCGYVIEIERGAPLPELGGGTALHAALAHIAHLRPSLVTVISDGEPDDPDAALDAGRQLGCQIHTLFCGSDNDHEAIAFLRALAWCSRDGIGRATVADMHNPNTITTDLRLLLTGPGQDG